MNTRLLTAFLSLVLIALLLYFWQMGDSQGDNSEPAPGTNGAVVAAPGEPIMEFEREEVRGVGEDMLGAETQSTPFDEAALRNELQTIFLAQRETANFEFASKTLWQNQQHLMDLVLKSSPDAALLSNYYFIQPEDLQQLHPSEQIIALSYLSEELRYLLEKGIIWKASSPEVGRLNAIDLVTGRFVVRYPAEALARSPAFGEVQEEQVRTQADSLQLLRLHVIHQYAPLEHKMGVLMSLIRSGQYLGRGQELLEQELASLEAEMARVRREYVTAIANLVGATKVPE